ncbi:hypothetical protein O181_060452 [Austropuccinia psidii MF-1]|uniref:Integrase catalytic domain-containing protein n=1 Tax=Austropuccinia psidii MF-1 TaxID=1389203 RepID=A0A9Q3HYF8_9BASI|nr:hypothetical protein [Austropuccinia psidii MF-1]
MHSVSSFRIFFTDSNSSILISQMTTLKLPVNGGSVLVHNVAYSDKISGTILSVGRLCTAGVVPCFDDLDLSLLVCGFLVTTTFKNNCWWMDVLTMGGTERLAAVPPSCDLSEIEMNPISQPSNTVLNLYKPLDLLALDVIGPFSSDTQGFCYLLTIRDHASTYSMVYPLKDQSDTPNAILDAIKQFQVQLRLTTKALRTENAREFTSASFTSLLSNLGVGFLPQENGEAERLNRTLGDMARLMMLQSKMPDRFWRFAYASACFLHNRLFLAPPAIIWRATLNCYALPFWSGCNCPCPRSAAMSQAISEGGVLPPAQTINVRQLAVMGPGKQQASSIRKRCAATLGQVPTERYFNNENTVMDTLPVAKDITIPEHLGQVLSGLLSHKWRKACKAELEQMLLRDVWEPVVKDNTMKTIGHRWVFNIKRCVDRTIEKFKACLIVRGDCQRPGVDCTETYAPTASLMLLRLVLAHAVCNNWVISSFDVSGAYLHSPVKETVFIEPPTFFFPELKGKALRLKKALYGMRQAGRCWWIFLLDILTQMGFAAMEVDQSLYLFHNSKVIVAIWIHVSNGVVALNSMAAMSDFRDRLCSEVDIKWQDTISQIVGLKCVFDKGEVVIAQKRLTDGIIAAYPRQVVKRDSPLPVLPKTFSAEKGDILDATPFCLVIGSLAYLVSGSRPDLAFAVNYLAPPKAHWDMLDHMVGYLLKTQHHQLKLQPEKVSLNLWSNTGWGGNLKQSQTSFMLKLGNAPILWCSKRQGVVALSTCAAEYIALSDSVQLLVQAICQLSHLSDSFDKTIFCNNQAAV